MNTRRSGHIAALLLSLLLAGCEREAPVRGFVLPPGDADRGRQVFIDYNCYRCHSIPDVELPERDFEPPFVVELGGEVLRVKGYGELLTAVVYPDHIISPKYQNLLNRAGKDVQMTAMPYFGDSMTVTELTDLVEFLHGQYTRLQPTYYQPHYPGIR
ncbi:hypothetical protein [Elongatibacter sediminis]|uniref:Cytochrome c domain-containing protein n=1 Tax=Elongatibacter sediminis TaxID=3119006 RepID=A0AAW9R984_9GAMM